MTNITLKKKILLAVSLSFVTASFPAFAQPSLADSIDAAVAENATAEWTFFGGKKGGDNGYWQRVVKYWKEGNTGRSDIDTRSEVMSDNNPWSAAFVSYIMARSNAGNQFKYSAAHHTYIVDAIKNKKEGKTTAPFVGYRLSEAAPLVGDLVCGYYGTSKVTYDSVSSLKFSKSHCDIVVATRVGKVDVIGGNVKASVTKATITLVNGKVPSSGNLFVLIRNNASADYSRVIAEGVLRFPGRPAVYYSNGTGEYCWFNSPASLQNLRGTNPEIRMQGGVLSKYKTTRFDGKCAAGKSLPSPHPDPNF